MKNKDFFAVFAESISLTMPTAVTLTVAKSPSAGGSVAGSQSGAAVRIIDCGTDCTETVNSGTVVNLTATAASGHRFKDWTGCDSANGRACAQTLGADETVTANFVQRRTLTVSPAPANGSVTASGIACGAGTTGDCSELVDSGASVNLTATPAAHHVVKSWSGGGCSGTGTTCEVTVSADTTVSVTFGKPTLRVSPKPTQGYVTGNGINCGSGAGRTTCSVALNKGAAVSLTATADSGYDFSSWSGGCSGTSSSCAFSLTQDTTVGAGFAAEPTYGTDTIYLLASTKPAKPTGGTELSHHLPPGGWTRTVPTPTLEQSAYCSKRTVTYVGGAFSSAAAWGDVQRCKYLTQRTEYVYKRAASSPPAPTGGGEVENHVPPGWEAAPEEPTLTEPVWRAQRRVTLEHTHGIATPRFKEATVWGGVVRYSYLTRETEHVYKRTADQPNAPTGGTEKKRGVRPPEWSLTSPDPTLTEPVWQAERTLTIKHRSGKADEVLSSTEWRSVETYSSKSEETEHVYKRTADQPSAPPGGATKQRSLVPAGWSATPGKPTLTEPVWRVQRTLTIKHTLGSDDEVLSSTEWGGVVKFRHASLDYIYTQAHRSPTAPTGGKSLEMHTPANWQRIRAFLRPGVPRFQAERERCYESDVFYEASSWGNITELLSVNAGGRYWADLALGRSYYSATVQATARGGTSPYAYRWEGKRTDGRSATYLFGRSGFYEKSVTATDADRDTAKDTAAITTRGQLGIGGVSDDFAHDLPLGGVLIFVWGGEGSVAATSDDAGIAAVSVSGAEIRVSGISSGRTEIAVRAGEDEFRLPVRVGDGE